MTVEEVRALADEIRGEVAKAVVGQEATVELMLVALFAGGHILLEGPPGTAKTLIAHSFARAVGLDFGRIQFTPDLMPGDVLGANIFDFRESAFHLVKGPIFTEILLADEINRAPPKTQAALLQAMQERVATIDGVDHHLGENFFVVPASLPAELDCNAKLVLEAKLGAVVRGAESHEGAAPAPDQRLFEPVTFVVPGSMYG